MTVTLLAIVALSMYGGFSLWRLRPYIVGTSLTGAWLWCVAAGCGWSLAAVLGATNPDSLRLASMRWLVLVLSFAPFVSRLGAKRPQDRAWHWVVLSFVVVFGLPAWRALLLDRAFQPSGWQDAFVVAIVALQVADTVATRLALPALLLGAAQIILHPAPVWWDISGRLGDVEILTSLLLAVLATSMTAREFRRCIRYAHGWSRVWLEWRDRFGVLWSLRLMQRFNEDIRRVGTAVQLTWHGFRFDSNERMQEADTLPEGAVHVFENLARRFVDPPWLKQVRDAPSTDEPGMIS